MFRPLTALKARRNTTFLFLASHGLRTHLSAIRWACSRLRKTIGAPLSKEQRHLINEAYHHTLTLTSAVNAMLLIGRIEQRDYEPRMEHFPLREFITHSKERVQERGVEWNVSLPPSDTVSADRTIVQAIFDCLEVLSIDAMSEPKRAFVNVERQHPYVTFAIHAPWEMPFLTAARATPVPQLGHMLGGTTGLMLSLAHELASAIGGSVQLEEVASGEEILISDGTVEMSEAPEDFVVSLKLPAA